MNNQDTQSEGSQSRTLRSRLGSAAIMAVAAFVIAFALPAPGMATMQWMAFHIVAGLFFAVIGFLVGLAIPVKASLGCLGTAVFLALSAIIGVVLARQRIP